MTRRAAIAGLGFVAVVAAGCSKNVGRRESTVPHGTTPEAIEAELAANEAALRDAGVAVPQPAPPPPAESPPPARDFDFDDDAGGQPPSAPESDEPVDAAPPADDEVSYEQEVRGPSKRARPELRSSRRDERERCERVCDLADTTCDLADHVCELADRHRDDPRYDEACLRAGMQCDAATLACDACED